MPSFARWRESKGRQRPAPMGRRRMPWRPLNAPVLHTKLHEPCTKCALAVRFEDYTAPDKIRPPAIECRHSRARAIQGSSETDLDWAQKGALAPPECTRIAYENARNMHSWRASWTPGTLRGKPFSAQVGAGVRLHPHFYLLRCWNGSILQDHQAGRGGASPGTGFTVGSSRRPGTEARGGCGWRC